MPLFLLHCCLPFLPFPLPSSLSPPLLDMFFPSFSLFSFLTSPYSCSPSFLSHPHFSLPFLSLFISHPSLFSSSRFLLRLLFLLSPIHHYRSPSSFFPSVSLPSFHPSSFIRLTLSPPILLLLHFSLSFLSPFPLLCPFQNPQDSSWKACWDEVWLNEAVQTDITGELLGKGQLVVWAYESVYITSIIFLTILTFVFWPIRVGHSGG